MKSSKLYNNISDKLKALIPKLKPNEIVTFRMLNGVPNPDPDPKEREKDPVLYGKQQIPTNTRIFDPYKGENGEYVDFCCADQWNGDQPVRFRFFMPGFGHYARFQGKFSLTGGNVSDEELYEFLFLSPHRKGSPCADSGVECLFEIVDQKSEAKTSFAKIDKLRLVLSYIEELKKDPIKAKAILAAFNKPSYQDEEVVMTNIHNIATDNKTMDDFIKTYESKETPIMGIIKEAQDAGIVSYDITTGEISVGNTTIVSLKIGSVSGFIKEFATWLRTSENGGDVLNNIKERLTQEGVVR